MKILQCISIPLFLVLLFPPVAHAEEPVLVYQRIYTLVAGVDDRISLRVWEDGRLEMRFPPYTTRAGHHQRTLSISELDALSEILDGLPNVSQRQLDERKAYIRSTQLVEVADADIVRFEYRHSERAPISLMAEAPDVWSDIARDATEIAAIDRTERSLREWMDQQIEKPEMLP